MLTFYVAPLLTALLKTILTVTTVWNTVETGDINYITHLGEVLQRRGGSKQSPKIVLLNLWMTP